MTDISYNNQPASGSQPIEFVQNTGSTQEPNSGQGDNKKLFITIGLIAFVLLMIILALYLSFAKPGTKRVPPQEVKTNLPDEPPGILR